MDQEKSVSTTRAIHAKAVELGKLVVRMTSDAGSGHPSTALALAHIVVELMYRQMRYDPTDPWHPANDRLVLSIGHAVPIVYAAYADLGGTVGVERADARPLTVDDLAALRELSSVLDGHPNPAEGFAFFDAATGSLGQGLSVGAGLALAARLDGIDKRIFVVAGDGESREGQVWEAADFIVDHGLNNVGLIFSCNRHGQAGPVSPQQSAEAISAKASAFGWQVIDVDGHDPDALSVAIERIGRCDRPVAIVARTIKGWGIDSIQSQNFHGKPVPKNDVARACEELDATGRRLQAFVDAGSMPALPPEWPRRPDQSSRAETAVPPGPAVGIDKALQRVGLEAALRDRKLATRVAYGAALVALGDADPRVVALDGDVSNSTFAEFFAKEHPDRFFECKIAEQNMITAAAGLAAAGKIPFASSFAKFIARAVDQIDMASISRANIKIVGSHAGVSLGADGPSQMSLADAAYFRSMTRADTGMGGIACHVFHPADAVAAYRCTELMARIDGLCYMRTHRPAVDFIYPLDETFEVGGCKRLRQGGHLTMVSCGVMLHEVRDVAEQLARDGIEVSVFDAYTFPLDPTPILDDARAGAKVVLTVEDNYIGGLHAELAEAAAETGDLRVRGLTVSRIPKSAKTARGVFGHVGVGPEQILDAARALVRA
jgi:transketolase